MSDLDNILDSTIDDLADLPETKAFPAGVHKATMFLSAPVPKAGKRQQVVAKFKYRAPVELADATAVPPNPDDECAVFIALFKKDGEVNTIGQGQVKQLLKPLKDGGLEGTTRELIEATKPGVDVTIVTTTRDYEGTAQLVLKSVELDT